MRECGGGDVPKQRAKVRGSLARAVATGTAPAGAAAAARVAGALGVGLVASAAARLVVKSTALAAHDICGCMGIKVNQYINKSVIGLTIRLTTINQKILSLLFVCMQCVPCPPIGTSLTL